MYTDYMYEWWVTLFSFMENVKCQGNVIDCLNIRILDTKKQAVMKGKKEKRLKKIIRA